MPDGAAQKGRIPHVMRQVGLWVSAVLIVAVSALSFYNIRDLIREREAAERTLALLREIEQLSSALKDGETGQRGFLITGDEAFLVPYQTATIAVPAALQQLRSRLANRPDQLRRLDEIDRLQRTMISLLAGNIEARQRGGPAAVDGGRLLQGKAAMDRIRVIVAEMDGVESRLLNERDAAADRRATYTLAALGFGTFTSIAVIVAVFYLLQLEAGRRQRAQDAVRALNADLERRVAERTAELARENAGRRDVEEMLRAIIEESPFAVVGLDPNRNIVAWSRAAERIFGYTAAEVLGRPYPLVPPEGQAEFDDIIRRTAAGERLQAYSVRRRHKSGKLVDVTFAGAPLHGTDGRLRGMVFVLEDVTEKRSIERQLHQAQRMEAVGQLTGGIAHDFNNILSIVLGNLDLLVERLGENTRERAMAEAATKGAERGADLVQRLLAFARRQPLMPKPIDLNERLPSLVALLHRTLGEPIAIMTVPGAALWPAVADPAQFENAILNLAINARDAMPGGGTLTIETANVRLDAGYAAANPEAVPGDYVMLAVSDSGEGMPPEIADRAFEPFFTTKETGKGTGLGLSMVYGFVKQSGGHVKIYSEVGHGTSVKLYLPRAGAPAQAAAAAGDRAAAGLARGSERVLLVEDNSGVREAVERMLNELGYRVHAVANGPEALVWLDRREPVDLLFTDIVMPAGMNGPDLAAEAAKRRPGLKVLYTTGYAEAGMQSGRGLAADALLIGKPYRKAELARMLRRAIDGGNGGGG